MIKSVHKVNSNDVFLTSVILIFHIFIVFSQAQLVDLDLFDVWWSVIILGFKYFPNSQII